MTVNFVLVVKLTAQLHTLLLDRTYYMTRLTESSYSAGCWDALNAVKEAIYLQLYIRIMTCKKLGMTECSNDVIHQAVFLGFGGGHPSITLHVLVYTLDGLPGVFCHDFL